MTQQVESPISQATFTFNNCVNAAGIIANSKKSGSNWFINNCSQWELSVDDEQRKFSVGVPKTTPWEIEFVAEKNFRCFMIRNSFHRIIKKLILSLHYIYFWGADSYYIFGDQHKITDGLITGFDDEFDTYSIVFVNENGADKIKIPQEAVYNALFSEHSQPLNMIHAFYIN